MSDPGELDDTERLMWTVLHRMESLALRNYRTHIPEMASDAKVALVERLATQVSDDLLAASPLAGPMDELMQAAEAGSAADALMVQGLILEPLGQTFYNHLADNAAAAPATRAMAVTGVESTTASIDKAVGLAPTHVGSDDLLYQEFISRTRETLSALNDMDEPLDDQFGEKYGLSFADLVGDFTAELIPTCAGLGMNRRQVVCHLTGAFMGV